MQTTSERGIAEIASHEAVVTSRYKDSVGVWTIGIGHTKAAGDPNPANVTGEMSIADIRAMFARDLAKYEARVRKAFTVPLAPHEFDAAVSFDFNTGAINRASWVEMINKGDRKGARAAFMRWNKPAEIIGRRERERDLFFTGRYSGNGMVMVYPSDTSSGRVLWNKGKRMRWQPPAIPSQPAQDAPKPVPAPVTPATHEPAPDKPAAGKAGPLAAAFAAIGLALAAAWGWLAAMPCNLLGILCN